MTSPWNANAATDEADVITHGLLALASDKLEDPATVAAIEAMLDPIYDHLQTCESLPACIEVLVPAFSFIIHNLAARLTIIAKATGGNPAWQAALTRVAAETIKIAFEENH